MAFLALSFILIAISTGLAIIYRSRLGKTFRLQLVDSVKDYFEDEFTQDAWDSLQRGFKCCGLLAGDLDLYQRAPYMVWQHNEEFRKSSGPRVPESCCQPVGRPTGMTYGQFRRECQGNLRFVYLDDCYIKVEQFIRPRALVAAILGVTLALMALLGVTCAALYATTMRVQVNDLRARQLTKGRAFRTQQIAADAIKSERSATATRPQNGAILPDGPSAGATGPYRAEFYGRQNLASEEPSRVRRVPLVTLDPRMVPARQRSKMAPKKVYPKPPWQ
ncbi:hypothetical protein HDE_13868 [Halotydeus destructor]|nr:hypothetical protein HDE_13868 [Halotydeus destructor]